MKLALVMEIVYESCHGFQRSWYCGTEKWLYIIMKFVLEVNCVAHYKQAPDELNAELGQMMMKFIIEMQWSLVGVWVN